MELKEFREKYEHKKVIEYPSEVSENPVVTVCVMTYNQVGYITECLEGILMQKTNFTVEILLGDDESSDGTREVCLEYAKLYPQKIRMFLHHRANNIKINGNSSGRFNFIYNLLSAKGKYIALCEGDDYWTDPLKLQKQVDFMENDEDCSLCFHATKHIYEDTALNQIKRPRNIPENHIIPIANLITKGGGAMATNSMFFLKKYIQNMPNWSREAAVGDVPLMLVLASRGKVGYIDRVMGTYRRMTPGSWSENLKDFKVFKKFHEERMKMWRAFDEWTSFKNHLAIKKRIKKMKLQYYKKTVGRLMNNLYQKNND